MLRRLFYKFKKQRALFNELYKNIDGTSLSKQDRNSVIKDDFSLVYGEIVFESFVALLSLAQPKKDEVFYDLGSGTGKAVIVAALTQDFVKCIGVELLPSLHQASKTVLQQLPHEISTKIEFLQADLFDTDLSAADIIFINGTGFFGETFEALIQTLTQLKSGTRIIITSKTLPTSNFKLLHQDVHLMSWGWAQVSVYCNLDGSE